MEDIIYRGFLNKGKVRIFFADTSNSCLEICSKHNLVGIAADALSRVISIASIMGVMQKTGKLTVKITSNGSFKTVLVDANSEGVVRGFIANPEAIGSKVEDFIGNLGTITVIKDMGLKAKFDSEIELQDGKVGTDFANYFKESEQCPSAVMVGSNVKDGVFKSGALIIQLLPGYGEEDIMFCEDFVNQAPTINEILAVDDHEGALKELFPQIEILSTTPVRFECNCSKERFIGALATLKVEDLDEMLNGEEETFELTCNFCNTQYILNKKDVQAAKDIKIGNIQ